MSIETFNTAKAHIDTILEEMDVKIDETTYLGEEGFRWELNIAPFGFVKLDLGFDDHLWLESIPTSAADIDTFMKGQLINLLSLLGKVHLEDQFFVNWVYPEGFDNDPLENGSTDIMESLRREQAKGEQR
jgi:hypothetical protein